MKKRLRVLIVEDVEDDAMLLLRELRKGGYEPDARRIETPEAMRAALDEGEWDLILSDFTLPRFNGTEALKLLKAQKLDIPFIVVSGTIGENVAVSMMRAGAHDYFLKGQLSRLLPAMERELREAQDRRARRKAEQERDRFFNLSLDMLCVAGFDGHFKQISPAGERMLGWSAEEFLRRPWMEFVHPDDRAESEAAHAQLRSGQAVFGFETRYRCKDGSYRHISWNLISLPEEELIFAVARDVTERRNLEDQLRQAQKMEAVGQLAGGVAHDFNNQLTVISGYTDILLQSLSEEGSSRESLNNIRQACGRAQHLTSQLLAFSRKQVLRPEVVDLNAILQEMSNPLLRMVGENIELSLVLGSELDSVKLDRTQFEQAMMNLILNARDALPAGGQVTIETANVDVDSARARRHVGLLSGRHVRVTVRDTGVGMSKAVCRQIFEPFFTTKDTGKGTGLGLSMVYGFVRQSGGVIDVASRPNQGTMFELYFPSTSDVIVPSEPTSESEAQGGHETILVAEDEESVRQFVVRVLRDAGYTALETANAREALPLGRDYAGEIDMLVADVVMPGMSGPDLAAQIRQVRPNIRILYMSGFTHTAVMEDIMSPAGSAFLGKPFTPDVLLRNVRKLLDVAAAKEP